MTDSIQKQEIAWVAGVGASAGLGAAVARRFARGGFNVAVSGRTATRVEAVAAEIRAAGHAAFALPLDIGQESDVVNGAAELSKQGQLSAAIFNAASGVWAKTLEITAEQFEQTWRVSTLGGFLFGREALRRLVPLGHGTLLFTGATASLRGRPPFGAFASAKAGLRSIAQTFAREFGPQGIHVAHVVIDGGIDGERVRTRSPERVQAAGQDGLLSPDAIAEVYWQLHVQHRSVWTQELDVRPFKEPF
jgi:NAD(P)-dependent dehydrogenase (short-subunit alcohol dehydrogenase family)